MTAATATTMMLLMDGFSPSALSMSFDSEDEDLSCDKDRLSAATCLRFDVLQACLIGRGRNIGDLAIFLATFSLVLLPRIHHFLFVVLVHGIPIRVISSPDTTVRHADAVPLATARILGTTASTDTLEGRSLVLDAATLRDAW